MFPTYLARSRYKMVQLAHMCFLLSDRLGLNILDWTNLFLRSGARRCQQLVLVRLVLVWLATVKLVTVK